MLLVVKNPPANVRDARDKGSITQGRKIPRRRKCQPTPVFLPGKSHEQRSLAGYIQSMGSQRVRHDWLSTHTYPRYMTWLQHERKSQKSSQVKFHYLKNKSQHTNCLYCTMLHPFSLEIAVYMTIELRNSPLIGKVGCWTATSTCRAKQMPKKGMSLA